jgi:hypothetical protein
LRPDQRRRGAARARGALINFAGGAVIEGNFADYEEDKKRRLGIDSVIPHRLKYKKFSR